MAGIYIHIPFCKQACYYCNFHFSTSLHFKNELIAAIVKEIEIQKNYLSNDPIATIYFGGGTPSLLSEMETQSILETIHKYFNVIADAEISFEVNPDDISATKLKEWENLGINRLSIGVQSFFEEDLQWMNRAHSSKQAIDNLKLATHFFENITADLIYGTPQLTNEKWKYNVFKMIELKIPHLSCYALTVEPKTNLFKKIREKQFENIDTDKQAEQFLQLMNWMEISGFEHYEISNFAKPGFHSKHNSSYWQQEKYLGIGPSAHSYNGSSRQWNVANNNQYRTAIEKGNLDFQIEELTKIQKINEYIMTSLRTKEGMNLQKLEATIKKQLEENAEKYIYTGKIKLENEKLILTNEGKLFADGIAADLFLVA